MGSSTLRAELSQRLQRDPQGVIRALRSAGIKMTKEDELNVNQGRLDQFSDEQLQQRFNKKVLEALGIKCDQPNAQNCGGKKAQPNNPQSQGCGNKCGNKGPNPRQQNSQPQSKNQNSQQNSQPQNKNQR